MEIELQNVKSKLMKTTSQYIEEVKDTPEHCNLTKVEKRGLKDLKKSDYVVFQTDKSGRFSIDSKENYKTACAPHISESDVEVSNEQHLDLQKNY